jgi:alkyl hydroperoxide reductase subunit AhpF
MIPERDSQTIRQHFSDNMTGDVEIIMFTERPSLIIIPGRETCETCEDTRKLLEEVSALSEKITLTVHELAAAREQAGALGINRVPAFVIKGATKGSVRFFGIPSGYEFSAFIADLVDASKGETDLSDDTLAFLGSLTEDLNIKVFTTPS